ncbi:MULTISPECIES: AraC family transcriptional regulator [unclassified Nocardioides]|uniref:AraC family transcriptional regulator n=1 Tax=unclassified Nocardioides TaxID=2615069 RepID=UPI001167A8B6|nr:MULTISPECIES: AraC family transcriptional regulator [unclassified Nocardioides]TQK69163.1 AraC family transcriptional regulator [Nocardioides sp. SLBN-35]WGY01531.1 AraC family transcriptional regulator [Nocardioides sp. QY071]
MSERVRGRSPRDWGSASRVVAEAYFPHELRLVGGVHEPRLTLRTLDLGPVMIGQVGWGADVAIDCDYPGAYEVNLPITGHLESRGRLGAVTSVAGQGTVFRADSPSLISHWDATCTVLGVKFDSAWFEVEAERLLGTDRIGVRELLPDQLRLDEGRGRAWRQLVASLATNLHDPHLFADSDLVRQQLAGALVAGLVDLCRSGDGAGPPARPWHVRRVVEGLHDDPARAWTAAEMAALAGTSVRRLQEAFQQWLGCTPSAYLLEIRLRRARADLAAEPAPMVSDVAARWGFSSASRFAAAYRRRYGEAPSAARR